MNKRQNDVYWAHFVHKGWSLYLAATAQGLCYVALSNESLETLQKWVHQHIPGADLVNDPGHLISYFEQFKEYLDGTRRDFTLFVDVRGTSFQQSVWQALSAIPYGETCTYSDIAETIRQPKAVRAAGAAIGANPVPIIIPCHRVIGKNGRLTGFRSGLDVKEKLLHIEKTDFSLPTS